MASLDGCRDIYNPLVMPCLFLCPTPLSIFAPCFLCCLLHGSKLLRLPLCACLLPSPYAFQLCCLLHGIKLLNCLCALHLLPSPSTFPTFSPLCASCHRPLPISIFVYVPCTVCVLSLSASNQNLAPPPITILICLIGYHCESGLNWT